MSEAILKNDKRLDEFMARVKKNAESEAKAGTSLVLTAIDLVRQSASGVVETYDQVKEVYNLFQGIAAKRMAASGHVKPGKPMGKRVREAQQSKLGAFFHLGQIKSVIVESIEDDQMTTHDYSGESAMDHVTRLYKAMETALPAYTAYCAAAVLLKKAAGANEHVTDAELTGVMSKSDKAKNNKNSKQWLEQACKIIGEVMNGTKKGVEQDNAKPVQDAFAILSGYLAKLTLAEEHKDFLARAAKVGYDVAKLESNPRPLAGRKRSQRRG